MKALKQQKEVLDIASEIIERESEEIYRLRAIVKRYYLMHGNTVFSGTISLEDKEDFRLSFDGETVSLIDSSKLQVKSQFQKIQELKRKLE